ncbi:MAG: GTPase of the mitochondrial inner membrane that associates with the large ribosomal subunit [Candelina mexicana]|nr:MAG: GTPase of the mitochondrial inner membrane that associates with the large ribosomal subunit [Candelina mexicana]
MRPLPTRHLTSSTLTPFLYPSLFSLIIPCRSFHQKTKIRHNCTTAISPTTEPSPSFPPNPSPTPHPEPSVLETHLDPSPSESYSSTSFTDVCTLTLSSGSGGHGCISFLREKFIAFGPANGGDGGSGGNIYIRAIRGETSLHKLARRGIIKAGRGRNGRGKAKGGERGGDVLISVPVGTVVREVGRRDPVAEREERERLQGGRENVEGDQRGKWRREDWLLYPGAIPSEYATVDFPALPRPRRSNLVSAQVSAPISLDLSTVSEKPILLAAGAMGGLGNPHFVTKSIPRPKFATRGEEGISLTLALELKLLADVGLVGLPNAGKSTLLRSLSASRARVGDWEFTTLSPNIGTVVLDNYKGRPLVRGREEIRTAFSIADIPGLIEGAHLDRGLGLGFLRHVERARVLAFVVDLGRGDAVEQLKGLWREVSQYETLRGRKDNEESEVRMVDWKPASTTAENNPPAVIDYTMKEQILPDFQLQPISAKPWFVVATKADLPSTQDRFANLQAYLDAVASGAVEHPSGLKNAWRRRLCGIPVSAIRGEGVHRITEWVVGLLDE